MQVDQLLRSFGLTSTGSPLLRFYAVQADSLLSDGAITPGTFIGSGTVVVPTYGVNIPIDLSKGNFFSIIVTDGVAFTIAAPTNAPTGVATGRSVRVQIKNASGGAHGAITWTGGAGGFHLAGALAAVANGNSKTVTFNWDGVNYAEGGRSAADVPN
jgi:hypothetical protein